MMCSELYSQAALTLGSKTTPFFQIGKFLVKELMQPLYGTTMQLLFRLLQSLTSFSMELLFRLKSDLLIHSAAVFRPI